MIENDSVDVSEVVTYGVYTKHYKTWTLHIWL